MQTTQTPDHFITQLALPDVLKWWKVRVNLDKSENTTLNKDTVHTNDPKKLESKLSDNKEIS